MKREEALPLAEEAIRRLTPACAQISLAGSLRREKPEVKDIEVVAQIADQTAFNTLFQRGVDEEFWNYDLEVRRVKGEKHKRLVILTEGEWPDIFEQGNPEHYIVLDLFLADADNWGGTLLIRTGNWQFSKGCMTPRMYPRPEVADPENPWIPGLMPKHLRQLDGYLQRVDDKGFAIGEIVTCPTEKDYFDRIYAPWIEPRERDLDALYRIRQLPR